MKRRNLLILIMLFILSLVGISFFGGPVTWVFFWLVILVPIFCLIYIFFVIFSLKIYQKSAGRDMVSSVPSDFYITLNNEGLFSFSCVRFIFYSSFSTVIGLDDATVYELAPRTSITRATKLVCRYRGQYEVGIKEIVVGDFLNLFSVRYRIKEPLTVIVSPNVIHLPSLRAGDDMPDVGRDSLTNRTEPDIPVRQYVPGDDIRLVSARASAVMQKLMIRERTGVEKSGIALIMDSARRHDAPEEYLPVENRIIESALALSLYYMEKHIPIDVFYRTNATIRPPVNNPGEFEKLYGAMKGFSFGDKETTAHLLDELALSGATAGYRMLIFILYDACADELSLMERMNVGGIPVRLYIVKNGENSGELSDVFDNNARYITIGTDRPTEDVL